ncbi:MAG: glycosyltransferase family 4 protein [Pseudomonadota bacterium]
MARILYVATSDVHLNTFHVPFFRMLDSEGHKVHVAAERRSDITLPHVDHFFDITFPRKMLSLEHVASVRKLKEIIHAGAYDLIHCHTPVPSALVRLAVARQAQGLPRVLYTAHGFHFYPGASLLRWLVYFPLEYLLSFRSDGIVCINKTDFYYSKRYFGAGATHLIPGVGVSPERFHRADAERRRELRYQLGISDNDFVLVYVAEFIPRKNHGFLLHALAELKKVIPSVKLVLVGTGVDFEKTRTLANRLGLDEQVMFLGFRRDVPEILPVADVGVSTSRHEGLGLGVAEQMMCGVPVVASLDKGHSELIDHEANGFLYRQGERDDFCRRIVALERQPALRQELGERARRNMEKFHLEKSLEAMSRIYQHYF